jgi:hypothetical protein
MRGIGRTPVNASSKDGRLSWAIGRARSAASLGRWRGAMSVRYVEKMAPRFVVETVDGHEQIRIKAQRNLFLMLFLLVWICGWTFGGISAMKALTVSFQPFLVFWLGGWALGWVVVVATLGWMLSGAEIVRVIGSDLEISYNLFGFTRRKLFRGSDIRDLSAYAIPIFGRYSQMSLPFLPGNKSGCVKFSYGARTMYLGAGLDESEGRLIVERLRKRLPASAATSA